MTDRKIAFQNHEHLKLLFGPNDRNLRKLREKLRIEVVFRGDEIRLSGPSEQVDLGSDIIGELREPSKDVACFPMKSLNECSIGAMPKRCSGGIID